MDLGRGMNCMPVDQKPSQSDFADDNMLALAFGVGWACADSAHLPVLSGAIARLLGVQAVKSTITRLDGTTLVEHAYPTTGKRQLEGTMATHVVTADLGPKYQLRIAI